MTHIDSGIVWAAIMFFWIVLGWLAGEAIDYTKSRLASAKAKRRRGNKSI